jgi:membrane-bound lytic murein transglycosylase D
MKKFMMKNHKIYILLLISVLLSFGCSLTKVSKVLDMINQETKPRESPSLPTEVVQDNEDVSDLEPPSEEEAVNPVNEDVLIVSRYEDNVNNAQEGSFEESPTDINESEESLEKQQVLLDTALELCETSQEYWNEGSLEKAIETLDEAYSLVLKVDTDKNPGLIQQKEDLRFMISKRILEIYASRYTAVNGNHQAIPLTLNKYVEEEIKRFQGSDRRFFIESYKRSGRYRDKIVKALKEAGLPEELSWLPLIESGFNVKALSRARALGLWQFIPSTGYKFGLKRDTWVDERLDPDKSTAAAIEYLKELHQIFGDWTTVLAAYNCGEGTVLRVIREQKINYLDDFWDLYEMLPYETARYVPRFLATLLILKEPDKYGFELPEPDVPVPYEVVSIERPVQLRAIAEKMQISLKGLIELNPELRRQATPPTRYSLKVPPGMGELLLAKIDEIPKWSPLDRAYVYHRVKRGETLSLIALRYRTTVGAIVRANKIKHRHFIRVGQKLKIPLKIGSRRLLALGSKKELLPGGKYQVKKGDSLWLIAKKFNTNIKTLKELNNLKTTRLYVGQVLQITE